MLVRQPPILLLILYSWAVLATPILDQLLKSQLKWDHHHHHRHPPATEDDPEVITDDLPTVLMATEIHRPDQDQDRLAYSMTLDPEGNIRMDWTPDYHDEQVDVQVVVEHLPVQSWLALGFSDRGQWARADLCVAWEDWKGALRVQDAHTDADGIIRIDANNNDCQKAAFQRRGQRAILRFRRKFRTCPHDQVYSIEDGTTHVVYAFGSGPLYRIDGLKPVAGQFGFQRTRLLKPATSVPPTPPDVRPLAITNLKVNVPAQETTYWCRTMRLPDHFHTKHHVLQFEAAIEEGREGIVHHMEVFHCEAASHEVIPEYNGPCNDNNRPEATKVCKRVLAAWAYGAGPFIYPKEAGLPIGGPDFNPYVMLEVHYNNPSLHGDWTDSSGIRLWYTSHLRQFDAGVMELGLEYTDKMAIPPRQNSFTLTGYCLPQCTAVSLPKTGITIFGSQLHTHLLGFRVVTRHFRGKTEMPELDRDNHYSTHYQEIRLLSKPVHVLPGDALLTTCWYDTSDKVNVSLGGFSISDEMCVNYVHYFPRINLEVCKSSIGWDPLKHYFKFMNEWEHQPTDPENKGVSDNYGSVDWTPLRSQTLEKLYTLSPVSMQCNQSSGERFPGDWEGLPPFGLPLPESEKDPTETHKEDCVENGDV